VLETLVVPLDGSDLAIRAVAAADAIAGASGAAISLVGVARDDGDAGSVRDHLRDAEAMITRDRVHDVDVLVGDDPATMLLQLATDSSIVLCLASHDHTKPVATLIHAVGSHIIERTTQPLVVVGPNLDEATLANDVVVAIDGVSDPDPLLSTAAAWAARLGAALRIVTVYEPVLPDLRNPEHFTRNHGPAGDPDAYLESVRARVDTQGVKGVDAVAIADPVNIAAGLERHLGEQSALLLVMGARREGAHVTPGVLRELVRTTTVPVLVVPTAQ
jgi:nucleotide-binding universal stress UspA family protein